MGRDWLPPTLQNLLTQTGILQSAFLRRFEPPPVGSRPTPCPRERIKNTPCGVSFISGGVRQFYGQLHTTTGNLQGNFAIFAIKTNFAPHAHGTFPDFHKIFPKQITGNLIPQNREIYLTIC